MGKTTDKHMATIAKQRDVADTALAKLQTLQTQHKTVAAQTIEYVNAMDAVANKYMPAGIRDRKFDEKIIERDPEYQKAAAAVVQVNAKLDGMSDALNEARDSLGTCVRALIADMKNFEAFVTAKKAKWTMKSKDTVPAAEKCIAETLAFIKRCAILL